MVRSGKMLSRLPVENVFETTDVTANAASVYWKEIFSNWKSRRANGKLYVFPTENFLTLDSADSFLPHQPSSTERKVIIRLDVDLNVLLFSLHRLFILRDDKFSCFVFVEEKRRFFKFSKLFRGRSRWLFSRNFFLAR